jgi:hypothetical protein
MDTGNDRRGGSTSRHITRFLSLTFGCLAIAWALPSLQQPSGKATVNRIIAGEPFNRNALNQLMTDLEAKARDKGCNPAVLQRIAIIRLRLVEQALSQGQGTERELTELRTSIHRSLACVPADPFLWLVLYSVETELKQPQLQYLRMSYRLGPNEGWIAINRNRVVSSVFDRLPSDLAEAAINEFAGMVASGFYDEAAKILGSSAPSVREQLLSRLGRISERGRQDFAKTLHAQENDITAPGLPHRDARPWN